MPQRLPEPGALKKLNLGFGKSTYIWSATQAENNEKYRRRACARQMEYFMKIKNAVLAACMSTLMIFALCPRADAAGAASPGEQPTQMPVTHTEASPPLRLAQSVNKATTPGTVPDGKKGATPKPDLRGKSGASKKSAPDSPRAGESAVSTNCARANVKCRQACFNTHCGPGTEGSSSVNFCAGSVPTPPAVNYLSCLGRCNTALKACKSGPQKQR
jgi:hypothetical protein